MFFMCLVLFAHKSLNYFTNHYEQTRINAMLILWTSVNYSVALFFTTHSQRYLCTSHRFCSVIYLTSQKCTCFLCSICVNFHHRETSPFPAPQPETFERTNERTFRSNENFVRGNFVYFYKRFCSFNRVELNRVNVKYV